MIKAMLDAVREKKPLVHCITNYVTVNDCANILLACGASPIMADDATEVEEITTLCGALYLNIGTLNTRTVESMLLAGKRANALGRPVVLDPVGAGTSALRTQTAQELLAQVRFTVIRGNSSEIRALAQGTADTQGVDASTADAITEDNLCQFLDFAKAFSAKTGAVIAITGAIDIVSDSKTTYIIRNGHSMMSRITGTGCMLSAVIAAYCAANPTDTLKATAVAVCAMGLCGEQAHLRTAKAGAGTGRFREALMDAMSLLDGNTLKAGADVEVR